MKKFTIIIYTLGNGVHEINAESENKEIIKKHLTCEIIREDFFWFYNSCKEEVCIVTDKITSFTILEAKKD